MTTNSPATRPPEPGSLELGPRLEWAIRESFLNYLSALDDTTVTVNGHVHVDVPSTFVFPVDSPAERDQIQSRGRVEITAHDGELSLKLGNPRLSLTDGTVTVLVEDQSSDWIEFARARTDIDSLEEALRDENDLTEVLLTLDGASLFGEMYGPGFRLAPLRFKSGQ